MSWQPEIDELKAREARAFEMGGTEKVARQHDNGRLTVRERIGKLADPDSFHEIGAVAGKAVYDDDGTMIEFRPANFVFGRAKVDGRRVVLAGDDFTVRGGAADARIGQKQVVAEQMANELKLPIIRLIEGTGGGGSVKSLEMDGRTYIPANPGWNWVVDNMATVPVVSLGLGPVAGLGAARMVTSHYSVLVKETAQMFIAGPPVVAQLGEVRTKEELGGTGIHTKNGAVDDDAKDEAEAFEKAKRFLSYLPSSVMELPPRVEPTDDPNRREESLLSIVPRERRKVYNMRKIINAVVDQGSFFEIGRQWGRPTITGLAHLDGWPVALLAGDPMHYGGGWTADAAQKAMRMADLAQTFHLPVVHLVDNPGFVIGLESEKAATIRHGARALAAVYQATVPWCSVVIRRSFGVAGAAHHNHTRFHYRYAWPSGDWGSLPIEGGLEAAYKSDLEAADDPDALKAEIEERLNRVRSPFRTAESFLIEEIIDPRDTRPLLCDFANIAAPLRQTGFSAAGMRP